MTTHTEFPDLQGWQACLAVAQGRLAHQELQGDLSLLYLQEDADDFDNQTDAILIPVELQARANGLSVEILADGHDLVRLRTQISGRLIVGGNQVAELKDRVWEITTALKVATAGRAHRVVADLAEPRRTIAHLHPRQGQYRRSGQRLAAVASDRRSSRHRPDLQSRQGPA